MHYWPECEAIKERCKKDNVAKMRMFKMHKWKYTKNWQKMIVPVRI